MQYGRIDRDSPLSPRRLAKLGLWLRDTVSSLASDVGQAILDDLHDITPRSTSERLLGTSDSDDTPKWYNSSEMIALLSSDSTYLNDPPPTDTREFSSFIMNPFEAEHILEQFPSLRMRIDHYRSTSQIYEEDLILKRLLFKIHQLRSEEELGLVVVNPRDSVLVESNETGEFIEWR